MWLGNFHECTNVYAPPWKGNKIAGDFHGKYCSLQLELSLQNTSFPLTLGVCIPETCDPTDLSNVAKRWLNMTVPNPDFTEMDFDIKIINQNCNRTARPLTTAGIGMIILLLIFAVVALIGSSITAFEYFVIKPIQEDCIFNAAMIELKSELNDDIKQSTISSNVETENKDSTAVLPEWVTKSKQYFNCFCLFTNGKQLFDTSSKDMLLCLHGIRFLASCWIILLHNSLLSFAVTGNLTEWKSHYGAWQLEVAINGIYAVDTFFLLSGFLVAYIFLKKAPIMDWSFRYIHRFIRITPAYMIALGFYTVLANYLGSGPFWIIQDIDPVCQKMWWLNLLYLNNFPSLENQCMGWNWYLANDMQFFVISPIILITLWRWPKLGYALLCVLICISFGFNFGFTYSYDIVPSIEMEAMYPDDRVNFAQAYIKFFEMLYIKPYTRISPYLVGIGLAFYTNYRKKNNQDKNHWITLTCGWIISSVMMFACVWGLGFLSRKPTTIEASFYNALKIPCFAFSVAWIIYVCITNQAGPVNSILGWKIFLPLSRLTYCAYLIHPIVQSCYLMSLKTPLHISNITMVTMYLGLQVPTYIMAFFVSVLFEIPILRLEKVIRRKATS